jgi:protein-S-isoprenylcysteine O-methyltransferase Ste14
VPPRRTRRASLVAGRRAGHGAASYAVSLAVFAYLAGFVSLRHAGAARRASRRPAGAALAVNGADRALRAQHSAMARPAFKQPGRGSSLRPPSAAPACWPNLVLAALFAFWRRWAASLVAGAPVAQAVVYGLYAVGWPSCSRPPSCSTADLFRAAPVWLHFRGRPYTTLPVATPLLYSRVRHPIYLGWMIVFWATPTMTLAHLLFAAGLTAYMLRAIRWEERDLIELHPQYAAHRQRVPMLVPRLGRGRTTPAR